MHDALLEHFADIASWSKPTGGYFFWLKLNEPVDTATLRKPAFAAQAGFQTGGVFSTQGNLSDYFRLSFAHYTEDEIREGIARLRPVFD